MERGRAGRDELSAQFWYHGVGDDKNGKILREPEQRTSSCGFVLSLKKPIQLFLLKCFFGGSWLEATVLCVLELQRCSNPAQILLRFWNPALQKGTGMLQLPVNGVRRKQNYLAASSTSRTAMTSCASGEAGSLNMNLVNPQILGETCGAFVQDWESAFITSACTELLLFYYLYPKILL